jgi:cell wall-associated NlpC family hydrolase
MQVSSSRRVGQSSTGYTIRSGDTLWAIASRLKAQGVLGSHQEIIALIMRMNPSIKNANLIYSGKTLKLPAAGTFTDGFTPSQGPRSGSTSQTAPMAQVSIPQGSSRADAIRAQAARWAVAQANDPRIGYSQTLGRFGNQTDRNGNKYFDCSGLCFTAYKNLGVTLGGNWTGAMRSTWRNWADQVPKNANVMKPGDLILMDGHVVMYIGNGKCVGAQTSHTAWDRQVTADINVQTYLNRPDAIVLRPHV